MIRIGTIKYVHGQKVFPEYDGFKRIEVMTYSSKYGSIGPYCLKDKDGKIMENIWQSCKVYPKVPKSIQRYSRYNQHIIWNHPEEVHVDENDIPNEKYWKWREKLANNKYPVRYPVTFSKEARASCIYSIWEGHKYGYVDARKHVYKPVYIHLVKNTPQFKELQEMISKGINLLIVEVDGPREESLEYYKDKYDVSDDFIENRTILATEDNLNIMLNDTKHPFGHGYCLAMALLDM